MVNFRTLVHCFNFKFDSLPMIPHFKSFNPFIMLEKQQKQQKSFFQENIKVSNVPGYALILRLVITIAQNVTIST